jgi:hypothetical protein
MSMTGFGHFLMMEDPQTFNRLLPRRLRVRLVMPRIAG